MHEGKGLHEHHRHDRKRVSCGVLTVSDTRDSRSDRAGALIEELLVGAGHQVRFRDWVADDEQAIRKKVQEAVARVELLVVTGGTGIAARDVTPEALEPLWRLRLEGFGELFRALSWKEVGARAVLSRAVGGIVEESLVFALPGAPQACELAVTEILLPLAGHGVGLLQG